MKKYFATFSVNRGQTYVPRENAWENTNKAKAIKDIREGAEGQVGGMHNCVWSVEDENGKVVAEGGRHNGIRFRNI